MYYKVHRNIRRNLSPKNQPDSQYFGIGEKPLIKPELETYQNNAGLHKLSFKSFLNYFPLWVKQ